MNFYKEKMFIFKMVTLSLIPFFLFSIFAIKASANDNYGCTSAVVPWIQSTNQDVVTNFIQTTYPIDNPNNNNTGSEVVWRRRTMYTIQQHLLRWDRRGPNEIFSEGFHPRRTGARYAINDGNIWTYANSNTPSIFVGTTIVRDGSNGSVNRWTPRSFNRGTTYAYDIFAPGGIDVNESLGSSYQYRNQYEIAFPGGINRQYIRSVTQYHNGRVVRVFNNPSFAPGANNIPPRRTLNRIPVVEWTPNHPDGNNPDTSSRETNDDLMFGGNGGENVDVPKDNNETEHIGNGVHQIGVPKKNDVVAQSLNGNNEFTIPNNQKNNTRWHFTYDADKDAYYIKNDYTHSSLKNNDFWRAKEIEDGRFALINTKNNRLLSREGESVTETTAINMIPEECKWDISAMDDQPIPSGGYYQINYKWNPNAFIGATIPNMESPVGVKPYCVDNSQIWKVKYDSYRKAYTILPIENENLALTWLSTGGNKISTYRFENNSDQYWYIRVNEDGDGYKLINYKDGYTEVSSDVTASSNTNAEWKFINFVEEPIPSGESTIEAKNYPDQVVDLPNNGYAPKLVTHSYTGARNQIWSMIDKKTGLYPSNYYVKSINTDTHMMTWDNTKGYSIIGYDWDRMKVNDDQKWRVIQDPSGYYRLHNVFDYNKVMTYRANHNLEVSNYAYYTSDPLAAANSYQLWNISSNKRGSIDNGKYVFASKSNYKNVIDFANGQIRIVKYFGQPSSVFDCHFYSGNGENGHYRISNGNSASAEWVLNYLPDKGAFTIRDFRSNDMITASGDHIRYEDYNGSSTQLWYVIPK